MISKERAVELAETYLAESGATWPWRGEPPELAVYDVEEYSVGWVAHWCTAEHLRDPQPTTVRNHVFVDRYDGSIHHVPEAWFGGGWEGKYLSQVKGVQRPDPLADRVRELALSDGVVAAMAHLRTAAPALSLTQAKAYVTAVRDGGDPPKDVWLLTLDRSAWTEFPIETLRGPAV
ncbi:hypothetical protein [Streptomyces sp. NPDC089919]|uniref:hypothetical protein n=1 Tax=Streptomyces sp. NPDC089919 TaxID=3155188 RepID=UPI0034464359